MNRPDLLRAASLAQSAMDAATIAVSFDRVRPERAEHFAKLAEDALYAALDALAQARMSRTSFFPAALDVVSGEPRVAA